MKTRLVQIGNSRGIRLPKAVLDEAQLSEDDVELKAEPGCIVIRSVRRPRAGWAELARQMGERGEDQLPAPPALTRFDREEWEWQ
jgi:antitoxin MazE